MSEPPPLPCAVRGLRWGAITDTACLKKMLMYSLWMGEAHTPLACVAHALAQWHTSERVPFLMNRLRTPTQLRAQYHEVAYEHVVAMLQESAIESRTNENEAMRAAVRHGPLAQAAMHGAERESHVRAFLAAIYRRECVVSTDAVWKCICYFYVLYGPMCLSSAPRSRAASIP